MIKHAPAIGIVVISTVALGDSAKLVPDDLPGPPPEVVKHAAVEVPAIPGFELPATEPGFHSPRELRVHGRPLLGTEIQVKGYITWVYDCVTELVASNPGSTRAQVQIAIHKDPTLCERPKFYLGDAKDTGRDASIWVVDVPRPPTRLERERLPKDELKAWPAVPKLATGDYVAVTGTWAVQSPHDEHNTEGLLVYKGLAPATPAASAAATKVATAASEPEVTVVTRPPLRKPVDDKARNASAGHFNTCNRANAARQLDAAIAACEAATRAWDGNHLAWYAWSSAHMAKGEWPRARTAIERAVALRPDQGMYQLYHGVALYEAEHQRVREEQARKDGKKPEEVGVDPTQLRLEPARDALRRAIKLAPDLWRAHFYLARVYRDMDDARRAAEQFSATIKAHPGYRFGYIALAELYLRWSYFDQALAVALLGTTNLPATEVSDMWFEAGMAYEGKHADDKAIEAFGKAIASNPDDAKAKFQRGQVHLRKGDLANARADLEDVMKSGDPRIAGVKAVARQLLSQIASRKR